MSLIIPNRVNSLSKLAGLCVMGRITFASEKVIIIADDAANSSDIDRANRQYPASRLYKPGPKIPFYAPFQSKSRHRK